MLMQKVNELQNEVLRQVENMCYHQMLNDEQTFEAKMEVRESFLRLKIILTGAKTENFSDNLKGFAADLITVQAKSLEAKHDPKLYVSTGSH